MCPVGRRRRRAEGGGGEADGFRVWAPHVACALAGVVGIWSIWAVCAGVGNDVRFDFQKRRGAWSERVPLLNPWFSGLPARQLRP